MKKTLLVMAAGMGSRYGGLKQIEAVGPHGQTLLDYSVFDAKRSGFSKVVFVIRESFAESFKKKFNQKRFGNDLEIHYVNQELNTLTGNFKINPARTKPWGTGHAVLVAKNAIHEPFLIINADDFYGSDAFVVAGKYLDKVVTQKTKYCLVGYQLAATLSVHGTICRGIITEKNGDLSHLEEHTDIQKIGRKITGLDRHGEAVTLAAKTLVSLNMFGCTPDYFDFANQNWREFLRDHAQDLKTEFYLPTTFDHLIKQKKARVKILPTSAKWFGITYKEDKALVVESIAKLTKQLVYPEKLW